LELINLLGLLGPAGPVAHTDGGAPTARACLADVEHLLAARFPVA
jgi:hypothetical protein